MSEGLNDDWAFSLCRQLERELNEAIAELEWERANQRERQRIRDEALLIEREARDAELWRVRAEAEAEGDAAAAALAEERAKAEREAAASAAALAAERAVRIEREARQEAFGAWIEQQAHKL
ncbi:MAG: hypothetical protein ACOVKL_01710 [Polynucleobacter sp.]